MKINQSSKLLTLLQRLSTKLVPFLLLLIGIPLLILLGFGVHAIYVQGYLLVFMVLITVCSSILAVVWWGFHAQSQQSLQNLQAVSAWVQVSPDWNDKDTQLWQALNQTIEQQLQENAEWVALREHALNLLTQTAQYYRSAKKHQTLAFSLVEMLSMVEEISRRYRLLLKEHVPAVEHINLSTLHWLYDHRDKYEKGKVLWNTYRVIRAFTPTGLLAEARSQIMNQVFGDLSVTVQLSLKRALLQEVAAVAIDLYSGRFKASEQEIIENQQLVEKQVPFAPSLEPIRIGLLGQVSAGKSSIVNALLGSMVAEVGQVPTTAMAQLYKASMADTDILYLLDLAGLDGNEKHDQALLEQLLKCDAVLWVLKANQPARALDLAFKQRWDAWFAKPENISRRPPVIIGVLNQVDRLPPLQEWQPPYDLENPITLKAKIIKEAVDYNRDLLKLDTLIPLAVGAERNYNLMALQQLLDDTYHKALQVQLNRRRLDTTTSASWQEQFQRVYRLGQSLFKVVRASQ